MKVLKNYAYNLFYQVLSIILPILTTPYVTRIFSSEDLGSYAYYNSIVTYFILFATLGIGNYGTRQISTASGQLRQTFWNLYWVQLTAGFLSLSAYLLACLYLPAMANPISYLLAFSLLSKVLDISWLFQGLEDFKRITLRNTSVKLLGVCAIFLFVKSPRDLLLYVFLLVFFELLGQLVMWWPAAAFIQKPSWDWQEIRENIKPVIILFLPQIAISLYVTLDRTLLGTMASAQDVGIFDQAQKIVSILLTIVTSLGSVMLPRVASLLSKGDLRSASKMHELSFRIYNVVIFPIVLGMLVINADFVRVFLGKDFQDARYAIAILIFKMIFIGWTNIMGVQILIPHNRNKAYMLSTTIPALISVSLNLVLIPQLGYIGAAATSLVTETLVWGIQISVTRAYLRGLDILGPLRKILLACGGMLLVLLPLRALLPDYPLQRVLILGLTGSLLYAALIVKLGVIRPDQLRLRK